MVGNHRNFKRRIIWLAAIFAVTLAIQADSQAPSRSAVRPPVRKEFLPPAPPEHKRRNLNNVSDLSADLGQVVAYLEEGQAYFRDYQSGTHSLVENAKFLKFLETYEGELVLAKKEVATLKIWIDNRGSLDSALP